MFLPKTARHQKEMGLQEKTLESETPATEGNELLTTETEFHLSETPPRTSVSEKQ